MINIELQKKEKIQDLEFMELLRKNMILFLKSKKEYVKFVIRRKILIQEEEIKLLNYLLIIIIIQEKLEDYYVQIAIKV